jgi:hypothetical protein
LLYSPRWLFLFPGTLLLALGLVAGVTLTITPVTIGSVTFDVGTLLYAVAAIVVGVEAVTFWLLTKVYAIEEGFMPPDQRMDRLFRWLRLETGLIIAAVLMVAGILTAIGSFLIWQSRGFGPLDTSTSVRIVVPAVTGLIVGAQVGLTSFFLSILGLGRRNRPVVGAPARLPDAAEQPVATTEGVPSA